MGGATSAAHGTIQDELSLDQAKQLAPPGTWDPRWDAQFTTARGRLHRNVALLLFAQRVEALDAAGVARGPAAPDAVDAALVSATTSARDLLALVRGAADVGGRLTKKAAPLQTARLELEAALRTCRVADVAGGSGAPAVVAKPPPIAKKAAKERTRFYYECVVAGRV